QLAIEN
ncbi:Intermediate transcription factor VITF-3 (1), partial [Monkeypox virus]